jgi:hypothetical protein
MTASAYHPTRSKRASPSFRERHGARRVRRSGRSVAVIERAGHETAAETLIATSR